MKKTIKHTLRKIGLSERETEVYIFVSKRGLLTRTEITRQLKLNKGQSYRLLKSLQKKGLVEKTLEYPTHFTAVPFEKILDSYVKSKREEAAHIEAVKKDLLSDWENIRPTELDSALEKFSVIEGNKKIFHKICQMIKETNSQFSMKSTISDLFKAEQFGVFDMYNRHPLKSKIAFRVITQLSKQNLKAIKLLTTKLKPNLDFRGRNPSLGSPRFTRMAIRDNEEILLFISDKKSLRDGKEACFCTNCKSIIEAFSSVFEDSWKDSVDIKEGITVIETGKILPKTQLFKDSAFARKNYYEILNSVNEEIMIVTTSKGLIGLSKNKSQLEEWAERGISIRIMAPIVTENLDVVQKLLKWCEVKHIPLGYFETTIIDGNHLFQFKRPVSKGVSYNESKFRDTYYTNDYDYIQKTKNMLYGLWHQAHKPSPYSIRTLSDSRFASIKSENQHHKLFKKTMAMRDVQYNQIVAMRNEVLDKIKQEQKLSSKESIHWNDTIRYFGSRAISVINAPKLFSVSKMVIGIFRFDDSSSFGSHNMMVIDLWEEKRDGGYFVPVALIQNIEKPLDLRKKIFKVIDEKNFRILKQNEFVVRMKGSTLFAGWTVPIPLEGHDITIPPCCLLFEGYGNIKSGSYVISFFSARRHEFWYNSVDAFVTLYHPKSKYIGAGTEGFLDTESVLLSTPY